MGFGNIGHSHLQAQDVDVANLQKLHESSQEKTEMQIVRQENLMESRQALADRGKLAEGNKSAKTKRGKGLKECLRVSRKKRAGESKGHQKVAKSRAEEKAKEHSIDNPELNQDMLMSLFERLEEGNSEEEVIEAVEEVYPDRYLAHCALEFLKEVTEEGSTLENTLDNALADYQEAHGRDIQIGKNIVNETREFADGAKMSPTQLRSWYRDTLDSKRGQIRTPVLVSTMIKTFGYEKMVKAAHFFLRALGAEVRCGNYNFERAELSDKLSQIRALQSNLQVFRSARKHMRVLDHALNAYIKKGFGEELP